MTDGVAEGCRGVDPRIERSRRIILATTLDLLAELGYGGLTIEAVAGRAGVGKSTIYRQWSGKPELVEAAIRTLKAGVVPPARGTVRQRLIVLLERIATRISDSTWSACLPAIIDGAERDPELLVIHQRFVREQRQVMVDLLAEGVARGELMIPADADLGLVAACLVGPIMVGRLLLQEPFDPANAAGLVSLVLPP